MTDHMRDQAAKQAAPRASGPVLGPWSGVRIGEAAPPFIWLHGWGMTHQSLMRLAALFRADGQHIVLDQPGFGATAKLPDTGGVAAGTADYGDALARLIDQHQAGKRHIIVGHSFGARVALRLAKARPDLASGLILIAGAGLRRRLSAAGHLRRWCIKQIGKLARVRDPHDERGMITAFRQRYGSRDYLAAGEMRGTLVRVVNEDLSEVARQVKCPVLLIYGADDTETPPEFAHRYETLIPIVRKHIISGCDHWDILERGAYKCEAAMRAFLADIGEGKG